MQIDIGEVLKYIGIVSVSIPAAGALISYFSRRLFENYLAKSIETHKANLERVNMLQQIQFGQLHTERATVIKELYLKLFDYRLMILEFYNSPLHPDYGIQDFTDRVRKWSKITPAFSTYFHRNRIYFNTDLCAILDKLNNELSAISDNTKAFLQSFQIIQEQVDAINNEDKIFVDLKNKINGQMADEIERTLKELEKEFRNLLGVDIKS